MKKIGKTMFCVLTCLMLILATVPAYAEGYKLVWTKPEITETQEGDVTISNKPDGYRIYYGRPGTELTEYVEVLGYDTEEISLLSLPLDNTKEWVFEATAFNESGESVRSNQVPLSDTAWPYFRPDPPSVQIVQ